MTMINLDHISEYHRRDGGTVIMTDGTELPVARQRKQRLVQMFKDESQFGGE